MAPLSLLVNSPAVVEASHALPGKIERVDAAADLAADVLGFLFVLDARSSVCFDSRLRHRILNRVARGPDGRRRVFALPRRIGSALVEREDAVIGSSQDRSIRRFGQGKDIQSVEAIGELLPARAAIGGDKDAAKTLVVHHSGKKPRRIRICRSAPIHQQRLYPAP